MGQAGIGHYHGCPSSNSSSRSYHYPLSQVNEFEVYETYVALKRHFTSDYDFHKYGGRVRVSVKSYESRKDRWQFQKIAKKQRDPKGFLLANLVLNPNVWIGDMTDEVYVKWQSVQEALTYRFTNDLAKLVRPFDDNFSVSDGQHPPALVAFIGGRITLETLTILDDLAGFSGHWNRALATDIIWESIHARVIKYRRFLTYDKAKIRKIIIDTFK